MKLPCQCPAPVRQGVARKGVVVVEESRGGDEQGNAEHGRYGGQGAERHDAPDDDEQSAKGEVKKI